MIHGNKSAVSRRDIMQDVDSKLDVFHLGLHRMYIEKDKKSRGTLHGMNRIGTISQTQATWGKTSEVLKRLFKEILPIAAGPVLFSVVGHIVRGIMPVAEGVLEVRILRVLENAIAVRSLDWRAFAFAVIPRLVVQRVNVEVMQWCRRGSNKIQARVKNYFDGIMFAGRLRIDLPTATLHDRRAIRHNHIGYQTITSTFSVIQQVVHVVGSVTFASSVARGGSASYNPGIVFSALCLLRPLCYSLLAILPRALTFNFSRRNWIFSTPRVIETASEDLQRNRALSGLVSGTYRMDIISGNLVEHIIDQHNKTLMVLENVDERTPDQIFAEREGTSRVLPIISGMFDGLLEYVPMVYYIIHIAYNPSEISITSVTTLQMSMRSLRSTYQSVTSSFSRMKQYGAQLQALYDLETVHNIVKDEGQLSYPGEKSSGEGMSLELRYVWLDTLPVACDQLKTTNPRNVVFNYPGSQAISSALDDVSFKIGAGDLTVIVGANGSGKSTLVNVLSRLYDTTSGQVLVDGIDIKEYKLFDIRRSIAILTQGHNLFPGFSLKENIALGDVDCSENEIEERIAEAVKKGGAERVVGKLEEGVDTVLNSMTPSQGYLLDEEDETNPLAVKFKQLRKVSSVSGAFPVPRYMLSGTLLTWPKLVGGERQRLVASRTFMRIQSDKIKLVAVDEPTSALDPEGELALFTRLREARKGKTMLFITHRFGPLTKYADNIICMKDGKVAEFGNHTTLMELNGEYRRMYSIQAKPFESGT
ncbi:hypothetical protein AAF712_005633 [Marasmius tenuissimus]|uniref:ABC transporter domain-containing protein n=1 Tax=Marasmius tenuissimus TaxID=585030 RepID=A0ABR3A301_9AGAR